MGTERNYARFYALLKKMPYADKSTLVEQYTHGRTTHLHETTASEYRTMCDEMERVTGYAERRKALQAKLRKKRSACLRLMQQLGVNTTDWPTVDNFCRNPRVSGKRFAQLDEERAWHLAGEASDDPETRRSEIPAESAAQAGANHDIHSLRRRHRRGINNNPLKTKNNGKTS